MTLPDLGNAHVIDWYLWQALGITTARTNALITFFDETGRKTYSERFDSEDWTRYDGELQ